MALTNILYYAVALAIMVLILKIISLPFKLIIKFVINSLIGGLVLLCLKFFGIVVNVTTWMILLVGFLGAPGAVIAVIISMFI
jgi:inhibitor of the pro-sigma K processing machinery